jgi:tetratricopeptide (TPR) repeat protein
MLIDDDAAFIPEPRARELPDPRPVVLVGGDESGELVLPARSGARGFVVATIAAPEQLITELDALTRLLDRRSSRTGKPKMFHANKDDGTTRRAVFDLIGRHALRIDATIIDKTALPDSVRSNRATLYNLMWSGHLRATLPAILAPNNRVILTIAHLGEYSRTAISETVVALTTGSSVIPLMEEALFGRGDPPPLENVYGAPALAWGWADAATDLLLQAADYCAWAIHREWEIGDARWLELIAHRLVNKRILSLPPEFEPPAEFVPRGGGGKPAERPLIWVGGARDAADDAERTVRTASRLELAATTTDLLKRQLMLLVPVIDNRRLDPARRLEATHIAVSLCGEVIARNPIDSLGRALMEICLYQEAHTLAVLGRPEEAIARYHDLEDRFRNDNDPHARRTVARGMVNRAVLHGKAGDHDTELALHETILLRYADEADHEFLEPLCKALLYSGEMLADRSYRHTATERLRRVIELIDRDEYDLTLRELRARALIRLGQELIADDQTEEGFRNINSVISEFGSSRESRLREKVHWAFVCKGEYLAENGRPADAVACYEAGLTGLTGFDEPPFELMRLRLSGRRAEALAMAGLPGNLEASASALEALERHLDPRLNVTRGRVMQAYGYALAAADRDAEAREMFEALIRFAIDSGDPDPRLLKYCEYARESIVQIDRAT